MKKTCLTLGSLLLAYSCASAAANAPVDTQTQASNPTPKHGAMSNPVARQLQCKNDGGFESPQDGSAIPNEACKTAFLFDESLQHWQRVPMFVEWQAYSQNLAGTTHPGEKVPDGKLCSAGIANYDGINEPHADWHKSTVNVYGDTAILTYHATQVHEPSDWKIYLTKPEFDSATQRLKWDDLEPLEITRVEIPEAPTGGIQPNYEGEYTIFVKIPEGYPRDKSAVIYTQWERIDPARETFFSCSDVTLKSSKAATLNVQPE